MSVKKKKSHVASIKLNTKHEKIHQIVSATRLKKKHNDLGYWNFEKCLSKR